MEASPLGAPRRWRELLKLGFGALIVCVCAGVTAWSAHRFAVSSPRFALESIEVVGSRRLDEAAVIDLAHLRLGDSLLGIDSRQVEARLVQDPWVERARVIRRLPRTLRVELTERAVSALLATEGRLFLLDLGGRAFKEWTPQDPHDLPVVSGLGVDELIRDRSQVEQRLARVAGLIRHYGELRISRSRPLQEVELMPGGELTLRVGSEGTALHLGAADWEKQLLRASGVFAELGPKVPSPKAVFLNDSARPERVVVRLP